MNGLIRKAIGVFVGAAIAMCAAAPAAHAYNYGADYQYHSYNWGAYDELGYYVMDNYSCMNIAATLYTDPTNIKSMAVVTYGDLSGNEHHKTGNLASWNSSLGQNGYVSSQAYYQISLSRGETGAMAYGWGYVDGPNGSRQRIGSDFFTLGMIDDFGPVVPGLSSLDKSPTSLASSVKWTPGSSNFIGKDGKLYGVSFVDSNNEVVVPDMIRIKLDSGETAYISPDEIDLMSQNEAAAEQAGGRKSNHRCGIRSNLFHRKRRDVIRGARICGGRNHRSWQIHH